jgi:hypothetical protein
MFDFPEPLFESFVDGEKLCLVCAQQKASDALRTVTRTIVPLCPDCRADWNLYGYLILRRIKPGLLVRRILSYKLLHPWQKPSWATVWHDVRGLQQWAGKMKRFLRA